MEIIDRKKAKAYYEYHLTPKTIHPTNIINLEYGVYCIMKEHCFNKGISYAESELSKLCVEFANYISQNWQYNGKCEYWDSLECDSKGRPVQLLDSTGQLFEQFLEYRKNNTTKE